MIKNYLTHIKENLIGLEPGDRIVYNLPPDLHQRYGEKQYGTFIKYLDDYAIISFDKNWTNGFSNFQGIKNYWSFLMTRNNDNIEKFNSIKIKKPDIDPYGEEDWDE